MTIRSDITMDWDSSPRIITVDAPSTEISIQDLIDSCRYLEAQQSAMDDDHLIDAAGKEALGGASFVGLTATLQNATLAFEARGGPTWVLCTIAGGNLVALDDNGEPIDPRHPTAYITIDRASSSSPTITEVEGGSLTTETIATAVWDKNLTTHITPNSSATAVKAGTYDGHITIDTVAGVPGTGWPIGTGYQPSNNLTDALTIMLYGNVDALITRSDLTITASHDVSNKTIETTGILGTSITFETGCAADKSAFRYANLEGELTNGDELLVESCSILNLANFTGIMNNVAFGQGSEVSIGYWATIIQGTAGGDPTNEVELSIGTSSLNMSDWTGNLKLMNKTGTNRTVVNCSSGNIIIDSTCVSGTIQVLGVGQIEADNSGPSCTVDIDGFITTTTASGALTEEEHDHLLALPKLGKMMGAL